MRLEAVARQKEAEAKQQEVDARQAVGDAARQERLNAATAQKFAEEKKAVSVCGVINDAGGMFAVLQDVDSLGRLC